MNFTKFYKTHIAFYDKIPIIQLKGNSIRYKKIAFNFNIKIFYSIHFVTR